MFEQLFKDRLTIAKHRNGPLSSEREAYLRKRKAEGYSADTLTRHAGELLLVAATLRNPAAGVTLQDIAKSSKRRTAKPNIKTMSERRYMSLATKWCKEMGVLKEEASPITALVEDYVSFLQAVRGLSSKTIVHHRWYVTDFLKWLSTQSDRSNPLKGVCAQQVDQFFINRCSERWTRASAACAARVLRSFFRHAHQSGFCPLPVADSIQSPRIYGLEKLPAGPSWHDVARVVEQMDNSRKADIRDKAVVMLCAVYGFRSSEICQLKLDDLDWENARIRVWRSKQRRRQEYPLVPGVGEAIIQYLRQVRPRSQRREVFLLLNAPFGTLTAQVVYEIVSRRYAKLGIASRNRGPHSLRHACAARLIDQGFSLKEVGDHLGHRYASVTSTYAKVDLRSLREVAAIVEGGVV